MGVRSYVPALGRFLSVDPVKGGSANAYEYAFGDPVNQFDLDGRCGPCFVGLGLTLRAAWTVASRSAARAAPRLASTLARARGIVAGVAAAGLGIVAAANRIATKLGPALYHLSVKTSIGRRLFGRAGVGGATRAGRFNRNNLLRIGIGWNQNKGRNVFRIAWCKRGSWCHGHKDIWPRKR